MFPSNLSSVCLFKHDSDFLELTFFVVVICVLLSDLHGWPLYHCFIANNSCCQTIAVSEVVQLLSLSSRHMRWNRLLRTISSQVLNISIEGGSTVSLSSVTSSDPLVVHFLTWCKMLLAFFAAEDA